MTTETEPLIERCAEAAFDAWGGARAAGGKPWLEQSDSLRQSFRNEAIAVLKAAGVL